MNNMVKGIIVAIVAGLIAWGAWVTLGVADAATKERVNDVQMRIEDKLDDIKDTILDLHKGD
jgi:hypothetical protein